MLGMLFVIGYLAADSVDAEWYWKTLAAAVATFVWITGMESYRRSWEKKKLREVFPNGKSASR